MLTNLISENILEAAIACKLTEEKRHVIKEIYSDDPVWAESKLANVFASDSPAKEGQNGFNFCSSLGLVSSYTRLLFEASRGFISSTKLEFWFRQKVGWI